MGFLCNLNTVTTTEIKFILFFKKNMHKLLHRIFYNRLTVVLQSSVNQNIFMIVSRWLKIYHERTLDLQHGFCVILIYFDYIIHLLGTRDEKRPLSSITVHDILSSA